MGVVVRRNGLDELPIEIVGHETIIYLGEEPSPQTFVDPNLHQSGT
jgi:hypothetical protein